MTHSSQPPSSFQQTRRRLIIGALLASGTAVLPYAWFQFQSRRATELWLSAQGIMDDEYSLGWMSPQGTEAQTVLSGFRGHGVVPHGSKPGHAILVGRRPGTVCLDINLYTGAIDAEIHCEPHHHLQGHAAFSQDGKHLFTSESHDETGEGQIVIRDAQTYQVLGAYSSHGIEPHEFKLMPDGNTLVIANGGMITRPEDGRTPLNLDTMDSKLVYLDLNSGQRLSEHRVQEPKASIRHLDVAADGTVAVAMQVQRAVTGHDRTVALGALHHPHSDSLVLLADPEPVIQRMNDYMGSVAVHSGKRIAGFSSPKGNLVAFWHLDDNRPLGHYSMHDVCGITVNQAGTHFVISNSGGQIRLLNADTLQENSSLRKTVSGMHWDNHLIAMTLPTA